MAATAGPTAPAADFAVRVRDSFARQKAMATIGARLLEVGPGRVAIELPYRDDLTQQHGFMHGGLIGMIADNACGYAAFSVMPADASVLTVEYKLNLMAPAEGERFVAEGRVVRAGRSLVTAEAKVVAHKGERRQMIAACLATIMTLHGRADAPRTAA